MPLGKDLVIRLDGLIKFYLQEIYKALRKSSVRAKRESLLKSLRKQPKAIQKSK
jgi:hypothetical protein